MRPLLRPVAVLLSLALLLGSFPCEGLAAQTAGRGGGQGAAVVLVPVGRLDLALAIRAQLSMAPSLGIESVLSSARVALDSTSSSPAQRAAASALLAAAARPEALLPQLKAELSRTAPGVIRDSASALEALGSESARTLAVSLAAPSEGKASLALPERLDLLFDARPRADSAGAGDGVEALGRVQDFYRPKPAPRPAAAPVPAPAAVPVAAARPVPVPIPVEPMLVAGPAPAAEPEAEAAPAPEAEPAIKVKEDPWWLKLLLIKGWLTRVIAAGHYRRTRRELVSLIQRLAIPGDNPDYSVTLQPNLDPNAYIYPDRADMGVHLGLLAYTADEDELASIVAHEMTHANKEQLKALADDPEVAVMLESLDGYKDLTPDQREEMRADMGALDRMVKAGFNPWGAYRVEKKFAKLFGKLADLKLIKFVFKWVFGRSFDYMEAHPLAEIRMAAVKAYIMRRGYKEDLSEITRKKNPLPLSLKLLRWRVAPLTWLLMTPWVWYFFAGKLLYSGVLWGIGLFGKDKAEAADKLASETASGAWDWTKQEVFSPIHEHVLAPVWNYFLAPVGSAIGHAIAWVWNMAWVPWETLVPGASRPASMLGLAVVLLSVKTVRWWVNGFWKELQKEDPTIYNRIVRVRDGLKEARRLLGARGEEALSAEELAGQLEQAKARLDDLSLLYVSDNKVRDSSLVSGLHRRRRGWLKLYRRLLAETERRLAALPASERAASPLADRDVWVGLPGFVAEDGPSRDLMGAVVALAQVQLPERDVFWKHARAQELMRSGTPAEVIDHVHDLMSADMRDTATRLFDARFHETLRASLSRGSQASGLAGQWRSAEIRLRRRGTFRDRGYLYALRRDARLLVSRLRYAGAPLADRIALAGSLELIPLASPRLISLRGWLGRLDLWLLMRILAWRTESLTGLARFVEGELKVRSAPLDHLAPLLHGLVVKRPAWIAGPADLEAMLRVDAFWPKVGQRPSGFLEQMLVRAVQDFGRNYPAQWKNEPASAERLHSLYLAKLRAFGLAPADFEGRLALWRRLTARGVTSATDATFAALYDEAPPASKDELEDLALKGHIWDQPMKAAIVEKRLRASDGYRRLLSMPAGPKRLLALGRLIRQLKKDYPERGIHFARILEGLSRELRSTAREAAYIHKAKIPGEAGEKAEDFSLRFLSYVLGEALGWRKSQQWALVKFLRGDAPPSRRIRKAFRTIGPERVRRFFEILPLPARVALLDHFLDSPRGLAGKVNLKKGYAAVIIDHVLPAGDREARRSAHEVLEAFLYSLQKTGNEGFQSYILSYMLALPKSETSSVGKTLRGVLEIFGASGIKIGQFLAASQLLPEEETRELRQLQERALVPDRHDVYTDLKEITGRKDLPVTLTDLLGAASIKYAAMGLEGETQAPVVLKVFRLSAIAHTNLEFSQLDFMAEYLGRQGSGRYGVFRAIVKAAKKAVARELSSKNEVERSRVAREVIYAGRGSAGAAVTAPNEVLLEPRLIASEYAPGVSLFELEPGAREAAAREILSMEGDIYFGDRESLSFDPDRHPGNYRIEALPGSRLRISPIDQGQGLTITRAERERILDLVALAQIVRESGSTAWAVAEAARLLGLDEREARALKRTLRGYFPDGTLKPVSAYYSLLAALDDAGREMDISYFDFVRGIIQFSQYEEFAPGLGETPRQRLEAEVGARARRLAKGLSLGPVEKARIAGHRLSRRIQGFRSVEFIREALRVRPVRRALRIAAVALALAAASLPFQAQLGEAADWVEYRAAGVQWPWLSEVESLRRELRELSSRDRRLALERAVLSVGDDRDRAVAAAQLLAEGAKAGAWRADDQLLSVFDTAVFASDREAREALLVQVLRLDSSELGAIGTERLQALLIQSRGVSQELFWTLRGRAVELAVQGRLDRRAVERELERLEFNAREGDAEYERLKTWRAKLAAPR